MTARVFWSVIISGGLGTALFAQAQSPFATKKKQQAWEVETSSAPSYTLPQNIETPVGSYSQSHAPAPSPQTYQPQTTHPSAAYASSLGAASSADYYNDNGATLAGGYSEPEPVISSSSMPRLVIPKPMPDYGQYAPQNNESSSTQSYGTYQQLQLPSVSSNQTRQAAQVATSRQGLNRNFQNYYHEQPSRTLSYKGGGQQYDLQGRSVTNGAGDYNPSQYYGQNKAQYGSQNNSQAYGQNYLQSHQGGYQGQPYSQDQPQKRSWKDRLGLGNITTTLSGFLKLGAAVVQRENDRLNTDDWGDGYIADGQIRGEASAITQGGLEYGAGLLLRGQYDEYRRGFGGRLGDCPPSIAGCPTVDIGGVSTAIRGHTSRFYTSGPDDAKETEFQLEGAYIFLRSSLGDVTLGRDDGAGYLFSLGAPSLVAVNASNSSVDYTGLDSVKTVNDASGFAEKVTYISPRLLGDRIGVGVQFGASYAPNARACGVDYCVRENGADGTSVLAPDLKDLIELGLSLDRQFTNGLSVEATATYATGSEDSGITAFDDLTSYGLGLEFGYHDFTLGGSWLQSNNGLIDGDYSAYDIGLSWKPSAWGGSISYGHSEDDLVNLSSDQVTLGLVYDISDQFTVGTGAQYIERTTAFADGATITDQTETGLGLFFEGKFKF